MTESTGIPNKNVLSRKVSVEVSCDLQTAYDFISSSDDLSLWLKKSGPIPGATHCEIINGPYDHVGAKRKVFFESGDSAEEELLNVDAPASYNYSIKHFSNFLEKLSGAAYGQLWFDKIDGRTRITWIYSFHYKNLFKRAILSLFLTFVYKKFMKESLINAKRCIESE